MALGEDIANRFVMLGKEIGKWVSVVVGVLKSTGIAKLP
jgi:hypothetical protein